MPKRGNKSAGRLPRPGASPVGAGGADSAGATSVETFTALSEAQRKAIRSTHDWPNGIDWCGKIEHVGRQFSEAWAEREAWVKELPPPGEERTREKERVERALLSTREQQKAWADSVLDDADLPDPGLKLRERRAEQWLYKYDTWVTPYSGKKNPMQNLLEWTLMSIWVEAGGKLRYSKKKDDSTTPYRPLVDFLTRALEAILGRTYSSFNIASIISKHRPIIANARGMPRRRRGQRFA